MKKMLFVVLALSPVAIFANGDVQTDIIPRVVNFVIFAAIIYFLLADKLKSFFTNRTKSIQAKLDEVQNLVEESKKKVEDAKQELEKSEIIAKQLVVDANKEIELIKERVSKTYDDEMKYLSNNFDSKLELETKKAKLTVVDEVLNELLNNDNMSISQNDLVNIILKKVA